MRNHAACGVKRSERGCVSLASLGHFLARDGSAGCNGFSAAQIDLCLFMFGQCHSVLRLRLHQARTRCIDLRSQRCVVGKSLAKAAASCRQIRVCLCQNNSSVSLVEPAAGVDALTAAALLVAQIIEAGAGADQLAAAAQWVRLLTEAAAGSDIGAGGVPGAYPVSITELAAGLDVLAGALASAMSETYRYDVPALQLRFDIPGSAGAWQFDVPSRGPSASP